MEFRIFLTIIGGFVLFRLFMVVIQYRQATAPA